MTGCIWYAAVKRMGGLRRFSREWGKALNRASHSGRGPQYNLRERTVVSGKAGRGGALTETERALPLMPLSGGLGC